MAILPGEGSGPLFICVVRGAWDGAIKPTGVIGDSAGFRSTSTSKAGCGGGHQTMRPLIIIASLEVATGLGIALFWALFFTVWVAPTHPPPAYFAFEYSFVLADIVLSAALLVAGTLLVFGQKWGCALSLSCAGGLIFLGLVDFSFNIRNGIYTADLVDGVLAAAINIWCLLIGILIAAGLGTQS